jgi:hypothetical protein
VVLITCDNCARRKPQNKEWILGFHIETSSEKVRRAAVLDVLGLELLRAEELVRSKSARRRPSRSLVINKRWDNRMISAEGAVHLCSSQCEDEYLNQLFRRRAA